MVENSPVDENGYQIDLGVGLISRNAKQLVRMGKKAPVIRETRSDATPSGTSRDDSVVESVYIADTRRRNLLRYLSVRSPAAITDVAEQLAAWQYQTEPEEITAARRERVQRRLLDTQIPRLRACGLVDYDETNDTVSLTDCGEAVVTG